MFRKPDLQRQRLRISEGVPGLKNLTFTKGAFPDAGLPGSAEGLKICPR